MRRAAEKIRDGEIVCLFPEGAIDPLRHASAVAARLRNHRAGGRGAGCAGLARSTMGLRFFPSKAGVFSQNGRNIFRIRRRWNSGKPLSPNEADIATVREELLKLGERCYSRRPALRDHLGAAAVRGLARHPFRTAVIDGMDKLVA